MLRRVRLGSLNLIAILVLYFAIPVNTDMPTSRLAVGVLLSLVAVTFVGVVVFRDLRDHRARLTGMRLLLLLEIVVFVFAFTYYVLAVTTDQMIGIDTRIDSLYFTVTTLTTAGYGDLRPGGQFARVLVTVQLAFDVAFLGALATLAREHRTRVAKEAELLPPTP